MAEMTSPPKRSRRGQRATINWPAARAFYLALPPEARSFKVVGERFDISAERVGQVARRDGWDRAAEETDEERERLERVELSRILRVEARSRADRLRRTLEVYDRANDLALQMLPLRPDGSIDLTQLSGGPPRLDALLERLPGLFRMGELAAGEATDRVEIATVQPVLVAFARIAVLAAPAERRGDVLRELEQASAGLIALDAPAVAT